MGVAARYKIGPQAQIVSKGLKYWFQVRNRFWQTPPTTLTIGPLLDRNSRVYISTYNNPKL